MNLKAKCFLWVLLIVASTCIFFLPVLQGGFLEWDDRVLFIGNLSYRGLSVSHWQWMCTTMLLGHWQPLTWLSCALDYKAWELNPFGWHATNLLIHTINAVLVYLLCLVLGRSCGIKRGSGIPACGKMADEGGRFGTGEESAYLPAALAALFWAVHPLRVEVVAWLATRGYLLCTTFCLLTVLFYLKFRGECFVTSDCGHDRARPPRVFYMAALLCFALATFTKGIGMMLPFVLLLLDWLPLRRIHSIRTTFFCTVEKIPFFALSLVSGIVAFLAKQGAGGMVSIETFSLWKRVVLATYSLWFYLWKTVVPVSLSPLYHRLPMEYSIPLLMAALLTVILALLWRGKRPWLLSAGVAYALLIFPMLGVTKSGVQLTADRFSYLSALPFSILAGVALSQVRRPFSRSVLMVAGTVVFFLGTFTLNQTNFWRNDLTLWRYASGLDLLNKNANNNFADACITAQRMEEGLVAMQQVAAAAERAGEKDVLGSAYNCMGLIQSAAGDNTKALEDFGRAIAINPQGDGGTLAMYNRATIFFRIGRYQEAAADLDAALKNSGLTGLDRLLRILMRAKVHEAVGSREGLVRDLYEVRSLSKVSARLQMQADEFVSSKIKKME